MAMHKSLRFTRLGMPYRLSVEVAKEIDEADGSEALAIAEEARTEAEQAQSTADSAKLAAGLTPMDFGAVGDGVADDTAAITEALQSGARINGDGRTYRVTSALVAGGGGMTNATLDFSGVSGLGATQYCMTVAGDGYGTTISLASDATAGQDSIQLSSTDGISVGSKIRIESDAFWASSAGIILSETGQVAGISGLTVTLTRPLEWSYLASDNGRVRQINMARTGFWGDLEFIGGGNNNAINFSFITGLRAGDFRFRGFLARNMGLTCCHDFSIGDVDADGSNGNPSLNYGVLVNDGSENGTIRSIRGTRLRHCFTGGGSGGINRAIHVATITGFESLAAEYDNHAACRDMSAGVITGIRSDYQSGEDALIVQGGNFNCASVNVDMRGTGRNGIFIQSMVDAPVGLFYEISASVRNSPANSFTAWTVGTADISSIKARIVSDTPASEAAYVVASSGDVASLDLDITSRGVTASGSAAIRVRNLDDVKRVARTTIRANSDRDSAYRNIQLQGTPTNPLSNVSVSGVLSGGTYGVFGSNVEVGSVNTAGVLFTGQSTGTTTGI